MEHVSLELADLVSNELSDSDRRRIERHLAGCPSCREEWQSIHLLADHQRPKPQVPSGYFAGLPARILKRRTEQRPVRTAAWVSALAGEYLAPAAAGALIVIGLWSVSFNSPDTPAAPSLPVTSAEVAEYVVSNEQWASVELSPLVGDLLSERLLVARETEGVFTPGLEDLEQPSVPDIIAGLNDEELEALINRMNERSVL